MSAIPCDALSHQQQKAETRPLLIAVLALTVFGLSLSFRDRDLGETSLDLQNGLKLVIWLAILSHCLFHAQKILGLLPSPSGLALSFISLLALASAAWSEKPLYTLACAIGFSAYVGLAGLCLRAFTEGEFHKIIQNLLLAFVGLSLVAAFVVPDLAWQPPSVEETQFRLQGFAANSNNFGRMAALLTLIGVGSFKRDKKITINTLLAISLGLVGLLLSGSRTGLFATAFAVGLVSLRFYRHRLFVCLSLMSAITVALIFASYGVTLDTLFKGMSRTGLESEILTLTGRTDLWAATWTLITERPFFGWGFNGTEERLSLMMGSDFFGTPVNPHQMFLHLALGLGVAGVFPALIFVFYRLKTFIAAPRPLDDLMALFILMNGMAEVDLFGTPLFTNIIFIRIIFEDSASKRHIP